jgi:hypothetical protein
MSIRPESGYQGDDFGWQTAVEYSKVEKNQQLCFLEYSQVLVFLKQLKDVARRFIRSALKDVNVELVKSHPAIQFSIET